MRKFKIRKIQAAILGLSVFLLWSFTAPQNDKYFEILKNLDIFATMYKEVNANYVDDINPNTIMEVGIDAMLSTLDPYTVYYPEDQIEDVRTENTGQYGGIGAIVGEKYDKRIMIIMPNEGFAAEKAGLKRGDEILSINGIDVRQDYDKASLYLRGQASSKLALKIERPGEGELDIEVELETIELPNVPYYGMVNEDVGLIKLTGFTDNASKEVKSALRQLKKDGAERIILDLRGNGGGLLNEAVNISNIFIDKGQLVVTTKGKLKEMNATYKTLNTGTDLDIPLAVLINSSSASASEIVAGTMQDYDRGVIIGRKSFGKGLVQRTMPLSYNSQMKVTIAKYYTPSGRCIQAIDYSNRNEDGSVGKIADSLQTAFQTNNGRVVFDGGGVDPDFGVNRNKLAPITISLLKADLFFRFGNEYNGEMPAGQVASEISISDEVLSEFKLWLAGQTLDYTSDIQEEIAQLREKASELGELERIQSQLEGLESAVANNLDSDLENSKEEIRHFIKEEFAARLLLERGIIEASFEVDEDVKKAIEILSDQAHYTQVLSGN
ncbi:S41 family peptidase [Roseivirga sp. E12]|uniref:S41 family peptidase n=1 Tax=Roseivirga sp. E12 TaxID=2819237 RepID=UPI001ABCFD5D|nr:S41 family peptidase [Roseivirga sp. E12]MBO3700874.1 S41 family peptidase [Roseivirga sp. E12]